MDGQQCLPMELILNIFSRLSPKILCRFKCLSKFFLVLISSDSHFKDLQLSQSLKNPRLLSCHLSISDDGLRSWYKLSQSTIDLTSGQMYDKFVLEISKSDTGFASFCQVTSYRELVCIFTDQQILVLNPATHQFISLCDYCEIQVNSVGIGYVHSRNEYKIVRLNRAKASTISHGLGCLVYTLKEGSSHDYTVSPHIFDGPPPDKRSNVEQQLPICVNGVLYWMSLERNDIHVYYLNLEDNSYGIIAGPKGNHVERYLLFNSKAKLVEMQGVLCIQCGSLRAKGCPIYALKDIEFGLWEHVYHISLPPEIRSVRFSGYGDMPGLKCLWIGRSYKPIFSPLIPQLLGFLPSNGTGEPGFVVDEYIGDETSQVHVVVDGTIKRSVEILFNLQKSRRLLYYEGLFSFN